MKYIYAGLGISGQNAAQLLKWHAKLTAKAGNGCIVRTLVEKNTLTVI